MDTLKWFISDTHGRIMVVRAQDKTHAQKIISVELAVHSITVAPSAVVAKPIPYKKVRAGVCYCAAD